MAEGGLQIGYVIDTLFNDCFLPKAKKGSFFVPGFFKALYNIYKDVGIRTRDSAAQRANHWVSLSYADSYVIYKLANSTGFFLRQRQVWRTYSYLLSLTLYFFNNYCTDIVLSVLGKLSKLVILAQIVCTLHLHNWSAKSKVYVHCPGLFPKE